MISVTASITSFVYTALLFVVFFSKPRLKNKENKIFSYMLCFSLIGIFLDSISGILYLNNVNMNSFLYLLLTKAIVSFYVIWDLLMLAYIIVISYSEKSTQLNKLLKIDKISMIVLTIIVWLAPIKITMMNKMPAPSGIGVNLVYITTMILVFVVVVILIKHFRNLKNKKYLPLFLYLLFGILMLLIQNITGILLITCVDVFITFLMYFTIENPDLKMIEQLNIARNQADKANAAKTDFLSNMSHEIRTPLNAIVGFSQSLGENEDLSDEAKDQVKDILAASDNLLEIVNGVLDISKIEANKLEIVNKEYSFKKVFQELEILTKSRIGEKPIELRTSMDPTIPPVLYGDYVRLKQIILNLLTNAAKYTKEGYIELKVSSVQKDGICRLIISVEDTGIGIAKEKIDKLFTKFERLDLEENITIEGTGLGLAITKKLVELMNGRIVVQSDYGFGSKFTVAIDQKIMEGVVLEDSKTGIIPQVGNIVGKKVLVVDDNALNLKVASMLLKKYSLMVETVSSGFECIEKWKRGERYDLILMDDMMPKMSGSETLKQLKEDPSFQTPVVALTANAISGMREKYLNDGFDDYLAKPIDRTELDRVLEHYLKK